MILVLSCTNRPGSRTSKVAEEYFSLLQGSGVETILYKFESLPQTLVHFVVDKNARSDDKVWQSVQALFNRATIVVFVIPEYNGSFPGILKTVIDTLEYPDSLKNKWCAMIGLGEGGQGGALAMSHFSDILNYLGAFVLPGRVRLPQVDKHIELKDGLDEVYTRLLRKQVSALLKVCHIPLSESEGEV